MVQQQRYTRFNPAQLLDSACQTIGEKKAEEIGIVRNGYRSFNFQHVKTFGEVVGNVVVMDFDGLVNFSESEDGIRNYGAFVGKAGLNLSGRPTLQTAIPCVVLPDRKNDTRQNAAVRESFAALCNGSESLEKVEVNPADVHLYQVMLEDNMTKTLLVIEAAGIFGQDAEGRNYYWSIMQHPLEPKIPEEPPKSRRTSRTPRRSAAPKKSSSDITPEHSAAVEGKMATVA